MVGGSVLYHSLTRLANGDQLGAKYPKLKLLAARRSIIVRVADDPLEAWRKHFERQRVIRQVEQARASHALAKSQSRMTVLCEIFIASAVSSTLNPPK